MIKLNYGRVHFISFHDSRHTLKWSLSQFQFEQIQLHHMISQVKLKVSHGLRIAAFTSKLMHPSDN